MQARGQAVPALDNRPTLNFWNLPAADCWGDLSGSIVWRDVKAWADYYHVNFDWLWATLCKAEEVVSEWQTTRSAFLSQGQKPSKKAPSPKT